MGCDIHAHVEYRNRDGASWSYFANVRIERNYLLFAYLAGVRNQFNTQVLVPPRGMPPDADMWTSARHRKQADAHSATWLTYNELLAAVPPDERGYIFEAMLMSMLVLAKTYGGDNVRLVFWFDN